MSKTGSLFDLLPRHIKLYPGSSRAASGSNPAGCQAVPGLENGHTGSNLPGTCWPGYYSRPVLQAVNCSWHGLAGTCQVERSAWPVLVTSRPVVWRENLLGWPVLGLAWIG